MFFSSYGTFMHRLLQSYYQNNTPKQKLKDEYLLGFFDNVAKNYPNAKVFNHYFEDGLSCIENLSPFPFEVIETEKLVEFEVCGKKVRGYIDVLGKDESGLYIVDHKSRTLEPRKKKRRKSDDELDEYLRQLYLYGEAVKQIYGSYPKELCFNCFRTGTLIREVFDEEKLREAIDWFNGVIERIKLEENFYASPEFFKCKYLCEQRDNCEYADMV